MMTTCARLLLAALLAPLAACLDAGTLDAAGPAGGADGGRAASADAGEPAPTPAPDAEPPPPRVLRVADGLTVLYTFSEGAGTRVDDRAPGEPKLPLTISDPLAATWIPGGGLAIVAPTIVRASIAPGKIFDACQISNEITFEAWVRPANDTQTGPARIFTYSTSTTNRNFTLAQDATSYDARLRTSQTDDNGTPSTNSGPGLVNPGAVQHVLFTRSLVEAAVWVDGVKIGVQALEGRFGGEWSRYYQLAIANELTLDRPWLGEIHLAAVYCRALTDAEVVQNFEAGYALE
jgi:hypothetical protein